MKALNTIKSKSYRELEEEANESPGGGDGPLENEPKNFYQSTTEEQEIDSGDEKEKRALMKSYRKFQKAKSTDKFRAFINWVEWKKSNNLETFYRYLKDFFFSTTKTATHIYQKSEIFCMAVSPDQTKLLVGCNNNLIYLWSLITSKSRSKPIRVLNGHTNKVSSIAVAPDGLEFFSSSYDTTIKIWNYRKCIHTLEGHSDPVLALAINIDGTILASGSEDQTIIIWNTSIRTKERTLIGHTSPIDTIVITPDSSSLISGSWDLTIKVWDLNSGVGYELSRPLEGHKDLVRALAISPTGDRLISGSADKTIIIWDLKTFKPIKTLKGHTDAVRSLVISPDGNILASGSSDKTVRVWDMKTGNCLNVLDGHAERIRALVMIDDGKKIISGCWDKIIRIWSIKEKKDRHYLKGHNAEVMDLVVSEDGMKVFSCGKDGVIFVWDLDKSEKIYTLEGHQGAVCSLALHPNGLSLISGGIDCKIIKWNLSSYTQTGEFIGHQDAIVAIKFFKGNLISAGLDKTLRIWSMMKDEEVTILRSHPGTIVALDVASWKMTIVTGIKEKIVYLWDFQTLNLIGSILVHDEAITFIKTSKELNGFVTGSVDGMIKLWNFSTISCLKTLIGHEGSVLSCKINHEGTKLISGGEDRSIRIWDLKSGKQIAISGNNKAPLRAMDASPDGTQLIYTGEENSIRLRRLNKIKTMNIIQVKKSVKCLDISKDEKIMVSATDENNLIVWDFNTFIKKQTLEGHSHQIFAVKISDNNQKAVSGSADNTIRVWDLIGLKNLKIFKGSSNKVTCLEIFANSTRLISGAYDNYLRLWDLEKLETIAEKTYLHASRITALTLSEDETRFFAAGFDYQIIIGDLSKFRKNSVLEGGQRNHNKIITSLIFINNKQKGEQLISGSYDKTVKIWDLKEETLIRTLNTESDVLSMTVNSSNTKLVLGLEERYIQMWDLQYYKKIAFLEGHANRVNAVKMLSESRRVVSGSSDACIRIWDINDAHQLPFVQGHSQAILQVTVTPDNQRAVSISKDKKVIVWDLKEGKQIKSFQNNSAVMSSLALTSDGLKAVVSTFTNEVLIWDIEKEELLKIWKCKSAIKSLVLSPDNQKVFLGCCDSFIRILDLEDGQELHVLEKHTGPVKNLCMNKTGQYLFSTGDDNLIILWDLNTYQVIKCMTGHENSVNKLLLSRDNLTLFSGSDDKTVFLWDLFTYRIKAKLQGNPGQIKALALSSDERLLFVGCCPEEHSNEAHFIIIWDLLNFTKLNQENFLSLTGCRSLAIVKSENTEQLLAASEKSLFLWNLNDFKLEKEMRGYSDRITFEYLTDDDKLILITDDHVITVWDLITFKIKIVLKGHRGNINDCLTTSSGKLISASYDKSIRIWDLNTGLEIAMLQGHSNSVNTIALAQDEQILISGSNDKSIRIWDLQNKNKQLRVWSSHGDSVTSIRIIHKTKFISAGNDRMIKLWNLDFTDLNQQGKIVVIISQQIQNLVISPDETLLLVTTTASTIQIWTTHNYEMLNETAIKANNVHSMPIFLSEKNPRLLLYFNKIFDCYNGEIVFSFQIYHDIISFYFDRKQLKFYYLSSNFELYRMEDFWMNNYLYMFLNHDALTSLAKDENIICNRTQSPFPFFLSFLHLSSIYDKKDNFDSKKMREIYGVENLPLNLFFQLDIFSNTPLDILIMQKNTHMIFKYFELLFENFDNPATTFYEKVRFLNYKFKQDQNILDMFGQIIDVCEDDYMILNNVMKRAYLEIDPKIYANNLIFDEMEKPIVIETDSLYTIDKNFIERKLREHFKGKTGEKTSIVKCKVICLPNMNDISNPKTSKIISHLADGDCMNEIYCNEVLYFLMEYIWETQIKFYYKLETIIFVFFFLLFNVNILVFYKDRCVDLTNTVFNPFSLTIDSLLIAYSLYCATNELGQMIACGFFDYFDSIWNYFDIILIPLMLGSSILDIYIIIDVTESNSPIIKIVFAVCMFCFWFRLLSFFRALPSTSYMMRLILNVITGVRHFVMFMVLFMLTLSSTFMVLIDDTDGSNSLWLTFYNIYKSTVGDYDAIEDYATDFQYVNQIILYASTFLFAIILLNLLVAILGDRHAEIKDAEDQTRLYELTNIIEDTNSALITKIMKCFKKPKERGAYLVCFYNDKHEADNKINQFEDLEKKFQEALGETNAKIENFEKVVTDNFERLNEYIQEMKENRQTKEGKYN